MEQFFHIPNHLCHFDTFHKYQVINNLSVLRSQHDYSVIETRIDVEKIVLVKNKRCVHFQVILWVFQVNKIKELICEHQLPFLNSNEFFLYEPNGINM